MKEQESQRPPEVSLEITGDGSHTLFVPLLNEHYHSVYGAITESEHIFIRAGLQSLPETMKEINQLEVGFGTGLNALLTCLDAEERKLVIRYTCLEKYPLPIEMTSQLNFAKRIHYHRNIQGQMPSEFKNSSEMTSQKISLIFHKIHESSWNNWIEITSHFHLLKILTDLDDFVPEREAFDLVYFDAFGPDVQPEMWTTDIFNKIASGMKRRGVLVTYSTKGVVKRNLKNAGFSIEKLPGPPGKREILRAVFNAP
jgi:tRNA U34 5-methylaminomethyl-2-thiouridine-forming methyltransferase MnmC